MRMDSFGWLPVLVLQNYWKTMYLISRALDKHEGGREIEASGSRSGKEAAGYGRGRCADLGRKTGVQK